MTEEFPERRWQLRIQGPISPDCSLDFISVLSSLDSTHVVKVVLDGELITLGERSIIPLHEGDVDDVTLFIGKRDYLGVRNSDEVPDRFEIDQAYPNPFNSAVMVSIALPEKTELRAEIFDVLGRKLFNNHWSSVGPGRVSFSWQGATSSGIYFVRVENSIGQVSIQKIVAVK